MLKYRIEQINKTRVIFLEGQVSIMERELLKRILSEEMNTVESDYVLELSHVFYIDSYGVSFFQQLILGHKTKMNVVIVTNHEYIYYVIRFNKFDKFIPLTIENSLEDALELYSKKESEENIINDLK